MDLGMTGYQVLGLELTPLQAEAANASIKQYPIPFFAEVIMFGAYITEDFIAQATDVALQLINTDKLGGTDTVLHTLTIGSSNSHSLKRGDGSFPDKVALAADTDLDNGHVVVANIPAGTNRKFQPGQMLEFNQSVAATGAGGAYVPFVILKISGPDFKSAKVWRETN